MADGSIKINVEADNKKAVKQLDSLNRKIEKLETGINQKTESKSAIEEQLAKAGAQADRTKSKIEEMKLSMSGMRRGTQSYTNQKGLLSDLNEEYRVQFAEVGRLSRERDKLSAGLAKDKAALQSATAEANRLTEQITRAPDGGEKLKAVVEAANEQMKRGTKNILKWGFGIRTLFILINKLRTFIKSAVKAYADADPETAKKINELKKSLNDLKTAWGAAFAPILSAVTPLLQTLIRWLTNAANAVGRFFAALNGQKTYKKAIAKTDQLAKSTQEVAEAAQDAQKGLMGIDDLTIMQDNKTTGAGTDVGTAYDLIKEMIDPDSFASRLALSVKDVLFDWKDLNGEQIAQKLITGLNILTGGIIGFKLGGVGGAAIGALAGLGISLVENALIFDHDGEISKSELEDIIAGIVTAFVLGAIVFTAGGGAGAVLLAATIGFVLGLALQKLFPAKDGSKLTEQEIEDAVVPPEVKKAMRKAMRDAGTEATEGIPEGVNAGINELDKAGEALSEKAAQVGDSAAGRLIDEIKATLSEKASHQDESLIGQLIAKIKEKLNSGMDETGQEAVNTITTRLETGLREEGESEVFYSTALEIGQQISNGVREGTDQAGMTAELDSFFAGIQSKYEGFKQKCGDIVKGIKDTFNFKLPHITLPHIEISYTAASSAVAKFLGITQIPHFSVNWYAKGGIVDGPTLIGAGEQGKEAIIPLERNTEWISRVAEKLRKMLFDGEELKAIPNEISRIPQSIDALTQAMTNIKLTVPAVASGSTIPLKSTYSSTGNEELMSRLGSFLDKFSSQSGMPTIYVAPVIELDGMQVSRGLYPYNQRVEKINGGSLVVS